MSQLSDLVAIIDDPATSDADSFGASDALAAAVDAIMRGPNHLSLKIEAIRIAEARGWDTHLADYLAILAECACGQDSKSAMNCVI